ncbi:MAG: hypothetical protein M0010_06620 [Actinomycetota bacterium]|nr:hypothetical protein [Actinomycetota bacterium]
MRPGVVGRLGPVERAERRLYPDEVFAQAIDHVFDEQLEIAQPLRDLVHAVGERSDGADEVPHEFAVCAGVGSGNRCDARAHLCPDTPSAAAPAMGMPALAASWLGAPRLGLAAASS